MGFWNYLIWMSSDPFFRQQNNTILIKAAVNSDDSVEYSMESFDSISPSPLSACSFSTDVTDLASLTCFTDYHYGYEINR